MPHPFKYFQRRYKIEQDVKDFRQLLYKNKYKIGIGSCTIFMLISKDSVVESIENRLETQLLSNLTKEQKTFNFFISFLKQSLIEILQDKQSIKEGSQFLEEVSRQPQVIDSISLLMLNALKDEELQHEILKLLKAILVELLHDKEIEKDLRELVIRILNDQALRVELVEVLKVSITSPEVADALVQLFQVGFADSRLKLATKDLLQYSLFEILLDENTAEKFKLFGFSILEEKDVAGQMQMEKVIDAISGKLIADKAEKEAQANKIINQAVRHQANLQSTPSKKNFYFF